MNRSQYAAMLRAIKENPANLAKFRAKFKNVYPFSDAIFKVLMVNENDPSRFITFINAMLDLRGDDRIKNFHFEVQEQPGILNNKTNIFDIIGTNERDEKVLVEVQQTDSDFYMDRLLYYTSRIITNHVKKSEDYELPRIYVLSILTCDQFELEPDIYFHHVHFVKNGEDYYPKLDLYFVEVEKFLKIDGLAEKSEKEKSQRAEMLRLFGDIINEKPVSTNFYDKDFCDSLKKDVSLEKFEDELFLREDVMINMAFEKQSSFRKGERIGALEKAREIAKRMIKAGDSDEKIASITELSLEDVVVLRSQLEA